MSDPIGLHSPVYGDFDIVGKTSKDFLVKPAVGNNNEWIETVAISLLNYQEPGGRMPWRGIYFEDLVAVHSEKKQVGGDHYAKHAIQPWDIIDAYGLDFYEGNAVKYLLRYKDKNGVEDLKKAIHYIEKIIEREQNA